MSCGDWSIDFLPSGTLKIADRTMLAICRWKRAFICLSVSPNLHHSRDTWPHCEKPVSSRQHRKRTKGILCLCKWDIFCRYPRYVLYTCHCYCAQENQSTSTDLSGSSPGNDDHGWGRYPFRKISLWSRWCSISDLSPTCEYKWSWNRLLAKKFLCTG